MFIKINYLMGYIKIYLYKLIYKNKFKFKKGLRVSPSIEINIFDKSKLEIGKDFYCRKRISFRIENGGKLFIGDRSFLNDGTMITCLKNIRIGNDVRIGQNVLIYDHDHNYKKDNVINEQGMSTESVIIEDNVWIGSNVIILKGSKIGSGSVIASGSIIKDTIPKNSLVYCKKELVIKDKNS